MVSEKKKTEKPAKKQVVDISSKHTDKEILALEAKDYALRFNEKDFRELGEETIAELSQANARDYFIAKGAFGALAKNAQRKALGFSGLEVVDPLRGKARNKLEVRGKEKGWHYCWKRPDEVEEAKQLGYKIPPDGSVKTPGASKTSTSHAIAAKDGKDDLVLMMVPEKLFEQHLQANAILSKRRAGATLKEVNSMVATANRHLESVADIPNMTETTTEEEVSIRADIARR